MSSTTVDTVTCKGCGWQQEFIMWSSLNVTLDAERKAQLLQGKLTRFVCKKCGWSAEAAYPLLYHDMTQRLMIWLVPSEGPAGNVNPPVGMFKPDYRFRRVGNRNELVEKILIFDAGLDDRIVEIFKLVIRTRSAQENHPLAGTLLFVAVSQAAGQESVIRFQHLADKQAEFVEMPLEELEHVRGSIADRLPTAEAERRQWLTVDSAYAGSLLDD